MKTRLQRQRGQAMTLMEVVMVIAIVAFMMFVVCSVTDTPRDQERAQRISCVSNLKQVNLSFRIWAGDHNNKYPMSYSTNGDALEWPATMNVAVYFQAISNELTTPRILICPADQEHNIAATNFTADFNNSHISYFAGVDADEAYPQRIMIGDDNFQIDGNPVGAGVSSFSTNTPIEWGPGRHDDPSCIPILGIPLEHHFCGNLGFADGSVAYVSTLGLQQALVLTGLATNRLAIP